LKSWLALSVVLACACSSAPSGASSQGSTLFHNGRIYLGHPEWRAVEALLVEDGRVVAAGSWADLEAQAPRAARVDLGGGVAVPGLQDAHGHIEGLGKALETVDLRGCASYDELIERVAAQAALQPAGSWIEGRGWDQNLWPDKRFPEHARLSQRVPRHPVFLRRVDGHAGLANAAALAAAGLDGEREVSGGEVLLDIGGEPSGVLIDAAMELVARAIPEPDDAARERRLLAAQDALLATGLTAVHDMGADPWTVETLSRWRDEGRWKLRVAVYLSVGAGTVAEDLRGFPRAADERDVVCAPGVKLYIDGALGSRGAALLEDYADRPGHRGLLLMEPDEYAAQIELCARLGLQPATHAIGDRGNRIVLDAYAAALSRHEGFAALRPRIEHAQVLAPQDWPRLAELGVTASMQPTHCTSDMVWAVDRLGPERSLGAYAWRRLAPDVAQIAGGSDFPVESERPLLGLYAARTRQDADGKPSGGFQPDQRLDAREALATFTVGAARAVRQEDRRGRLEPGWFADLTVLDVDPLLCEPRDLLTARVLATVINGAVVHRAPRALR
jgi:predicted amidohydrolase YtcJ